MISPWCRTPTETPGMLVMFNICRRIGPSPSKPDLTSLWTRVWVSFYCCGREFRHLHGFGIFDYRWQLAQETFFSFEKDLRRYGGAAHKEEHSASRGVYFLPCNTTTTHRLNIKRGRFIKKIKKFNPPYFKLYITKIMKALKLYMAFCGVPCSLGTYVPLRLQFCRPSQ